MNYYECMFVQCSHVELRLDLSLHVHISLCILCSKVYLLRFSQNLLPIMLISWICNMLISFADYFI